MERRVQAGNATKRTFQVAFHGTRSVPDLLSFLSGRGHSPHLVPESVEWTGAREKVRHSLSAVANIFSTNTVTF